MSYATLELKNKDQKLIVEEEKVLNGWTPSNLTQMEAY